MMYLLLLILYIVSAVVVQLLAGNFPVSFMAFPLNAVFLLLWLAVSSWLYRDSRNSGFVIFILSPFATIASVSLFIVCCLIAGFGVKDFVSSWIFVAVMLFLMTVLLFVVMRGWRSGRKVRWYFLANHVGLLLVLVSGFFGAADIQTLRMPAVRDKVSYEAFFRDGGRTYTDYGIVLKDFTVEYFDNGTPSEFAAVVEIDGKQAEIEVNHPYRAGFAEDIYITGYDRSKGSETAYCVLQIVRDPWRYLTLTGIIVMIAGAFFLFIKGPDFKRKYI